jgi:hypothetical protein
MSIFLGCSSNHTEKINPIIKATKINTSLYYQGRGSGRNRVEALNQALKDVASQISVSIKYEGISNTKIINNIGKHKFLEELKSKVQETSFYGYKIIQEGHRDNFYEIILLVNKKNLASSYAKNLEYAIIPIEEKVKYSSSNFKKYLIVKNSKIPSLYAQLKLIYLIDKNYPIANYEKRFKNYFSILSQPIVFNIKGNNSKTINISKNFLNQKGFLVAKTGEVSFIIELSKIEKNKLYHQYVGTADAIVTIRSKSKNIVSKTFKLSGVSTLSEHYVEQDILKKLAIKLNEELKDVL